MLKKEKKRAAEAISQLERHGQAPMPRPASTQSDGPVSNGHGQQTSSRMAAGFAAGEGRAQRERAPSLDAVDSRKPSTRENSSDFEEKAKKKICKLLICIGAHQC